MENVTLMPFYCSQQWGIGIAAFCVRIGAVDNLKSSAANHEFALVAKAYEKQAEKADRNVVFFRIPIDTSPQVFKYHDIQAAQIITFLSSSDVVSKKVPQRVPSHC